MDAVHVRQGEALLRNAHPRSFIGGFVEGMDGTNAELLPAAGIGFSHGGIIHADVFEECRALIVDGLTAAMPLDGVYLALHGAAVAEAPYTDAEGELIAEIRRRLGDVPLVGTYDFHAIMSEKEVEMLVPFPNNTNPHIDGYERGLEAAACLPKMIRGEIQPVTCRTLVPILGPNIGQSTWSHIPVEEECLLLYQLNKKREELEKTPGVINITIMGGYGYGDSPDASMSILATTDNDPTLAEKVTMELAKELWERRSELETVRPIYTIDEGIEQAMAREESPVLLVDLGDDPGSACPADSPAVLYYL